MLFYRNELKFVCTDAELAVLRVRLASVMRRDTHQDGSCYRIRSLYFDDYENSAMQENAAGTDLRKKYRIRYYNGDPRLMRLEIKSKRHARTHKQSCIVDRALCEDMLQGRFPAPGSAQDAPLNALLLLCHTALLRPRLIVEYERTAFVHPLGNVRVTFDRNICCSGRAADFFDERLFATPVQPPDTHVLEVKYDELLPDFIAQALEISTLRQSAFSKYYLGRIAVQGGFAQ